MPSGWSLDPDGNIRARQMVTDPPEADYRTRLIGLLGLKAAELMRDFAVFFMLSKSPYLLHEKVRTKACGEVSSRLLKGCFKPTDFRSAILILRLFFCRLSVAWKLIHKSLVLFFFVSNAVGRNGQLSTTRCVE